jgi:hypothetical protein
VAVAVLVASPLTALAVALPPTPPLVPLVPGLPLIPFVPDVPALPTSVMEKATEVPCNTNSRTTAIKTAFQLSKHLSGNDNISFPSMKKYKNVSLD